MRRWWGIRFSTKWGGGRWTSAFLAQQRERPGPLVLILPGSRTQEVSHNLPWFLKAAARVRQAVPAARFAVGAFREDHAEIVRRAVAKHAEEPRENGEGGIPATTTGFPLVPRMFMSARRRS